GPAGPRPMAEVGDQAAVRMVNCANADRHDLSVCVAPIDFAYLSGNVRSTGPPGEQAAFRRSSGCPSHFPLAGGQTMKTRHRRGTSVPCREENPVPRPRGSSGARRALYIRDGARAAGTALLTAASAWLAGCSSDRHALATAPRAEPVADVSAQATSVELPENAIIAGATTLGGPLAGLNGAELARFSVGQEDFEEVEEAGDG